MNASFQALGNRVGATEKLIQFCERGLCGRFVLTRNLGPEISQEGLRTLSQLLRSEFWF